MPEKLDFKSIATDTDILDVAALFNITFSKDNRASCPGCTGTHDRNLELLPETNSFRCYTGTPKPGNKYLAGDCIALYAHLRGYNGMYKAALELRDHFSASATAERKTATPPQKPEGRTEKSQPAPSFDPAAFAAQLQYTDEVAALGLSKEDAQRFRVGVHRGKLYVPICPEDVAPPAWMECHDGELKLPSKWLAPSNVVPLKRPA